MFLLVNNLHEKRNASQKVKTDEIWAARAICNLHSCYVKIALVFSQPDARNFFMYIITEQIRFIAPW